MQFYIIMVLVIFTLFVILASAYWEYKASKRETGLGERIAGIQAELLSLLKGVPPSMREKIIWHVLDLLSVEEKDEGVSQG